MDLVCARFHSAASAAAPRHLSLTCRGGSSFCRSPPSSGREGWEGGGCFTVSGRPAVLSLAVVASRSTCGA